MGIKIKIAFSVNWNHLRSILCHYYVEFDPALSQCWLEVQMKSRPWCLWWEYWWWNSTKIRPKELGMLNTPTHLSRFHPKFLSLDETLVGWGRCNVNIDRPQLQLHSRGVGPFTLLHHWAGLNRTHTLVCWCLWQHPTYRNMFTSSLTLL